MGGGGGIEGGVAACNSLCAYGVQCLEHAPSGKINLDHMRGLLRPLETTITMQHLWQLECNSGD